MSPLLAQAGNVEAPPIDWMALSPLVALTGGLCLVLLVGLVRAPFVRYTLVPLLTLADARRGRRAGHRAVGRERVDHLRRAGHGRPHAACSRCSSSSSAAATVLLSWRGLAVREAGHGEFHCLLLTAVLGMVVLAGASNLVTLFIGFELLSIPLYVLCATEMRRATSLESGLKYLIIGSVGSATLLYGLALIYGATGATDFAAIAAGVGRTASATCCCSPASRSCVAGLAFKASVAPFHQWTPDVYEGAPTPVTAFMAVATKAAAFGVMLRLFDVALIDAATDWAPALAALAAITIVVGNVGALGQSLAEAPARLLRRVAQAGYMLAGVVVARSSGCRRSSSTSPSTC